MAEADGQEKTEQASGKKLGEARDKGQVAKSVELNSFAVFSTGLLLVYMTNKFLGNKISLFTYNIFHDLDKLQLRRDLVIEYAIKGSLFFISTCAPIFIGLVVISIIASYGQIGFKFSTEALSPKMSKFNPLSNLKGIFFSSRSFIEVGKSLIKLFIIGLFTYNALKDFVVNSTGLVNYSIDEIVIFMIEASYSLLIKIASVYAIMAFADFAYQKYKFRNDMMMTKVEVKEESKSQDGDPQIKGKIRSAQLKAAKSRMMKEIPKADVVITNPTHFAVALQYDLANDSAPKVIAKGVDALAQRIKKIAVENEVPLHEDRELARALYKMCEVGDEIPGDLFKTVAQILAYIFRLRNEKKRKSIV
ncbi:MAG: flagellar biosynthesis protein FlhB [Ignavibacteria bacterium]